MTTFRFTTKPTIKDSELGIFITAPQDQGQAIEVSYAWAINGWFMVKRINDRGAKKTSYRLLEVDESLDDGCIDVYNGMIPKKKHIVSDKSCVVEN